MSKTLLICGIAVAFLMICENALSFRRSDMEMIWTFDEQNGLWEASAEDITYRLTQTPLGLSDTSIEMSIDGKILRLSGFGFSFMGTKITGAKYAPEDSARRLVIEHELTDGSVLMAKLWIDPASNLLRCHLPDLTKASRVEIGNSNRDVFRLYQDYGWVIERPHGKFNRRRMMTNFAVIEYEDSLFQLQACDQSGGCRFDEDERLCSIYTLYRVSHATFTLGISTSGVADIVRRYRACVEPEPSPYTVEVAGKMLLDDWHGGPYSATTEIVKDLLYYGASELMVIVHNWQHFGYDVKLPDIFPPNDRSGGLDELKKVADYCRDNSVLFGLHDNYSDYYDDAPSFDISKAALRPGEWPGEEKYHRGWYNRATDKRAYMLAAPVISGFASRNFNLLTEAMPISTYFLDVTSYSDPMPQEHPAGTFLTPDASMEYRKELYRLAQKSFNGPILGEGCMEKYIGVVDGANSDLWSVDRWGVDPKPDDWEYFPLFDLAFHDKVVLQGASYHSRYKVPNQVPFAPEIFDVPRMDDYRSTSMLFGHAYLYFWAGPSYVTNLSKVLKEYYLSVPFHKNVGSVPMTDIEGVDGSIHRYRVTYSNGTTVHVNRAEDDWIVDSWTLPQYGTLVQGDGIFQGTFILDGGIADVVRTPNLIFVDMRGQEREYSGIKTDGAIVVRRQDNEILIRPLYGVTQVSIDVQKVFPQESFNNRKLIVKNKAGDVVKQESLSSRQIHITEAESKHRDPDESFRLDSRGRIKWRDTYYYTYVIK